MTRNTTKTTASNIIPIEGRVMEPNFKSLIEMLQTKRPDNSATEETFIRNHLLPLEMQVDDFGNLSKRIGRDPVIWSCHTDTVHRKQGKQKIKIKKSLLSLENKSDSNCLGADDTAGVWLMSEMIRANRPGLYIFHRAEEIGGLGSNYIANKTPNILSGFNYAIALDRRGSDSVITHQGLGRCCSDAFASELSKRLGGSYRPDDSGVFTDTANYVDHIPECTNLSVGYEHEHTNKENLNLDHLLDLRRALLTLDTTGLPVDRDPTKREDEYQWLDDPQYDQDQSIPKHTLLELVKRNPHEIADLLTEYGYSADDIIQEIYARGGVIPY